MASQAAWALVIEAVGLAASAVTFLALVPFLEPAAYGEFGAIMAIIAVAGPVATFGSGVLLVKRAANRSRWAEDLGTALSVTVAGTLASSLLLAALAPLLLPGIDLLVLVLFLVGQLSFFWLAELAIWFTVALSRLRLGAGLRVLGAAARLLALGLFVVMGPHTLLGWAWWSLCGTAVAMVSMHVAMAVALGSRPVWVRPPLSEFRTGLPFALSQTTEGFLEASDRPLLVRYGHEVGAGYYAAGGRLVSLGYVPLMAVIRANDRRVFQAGARGLGDGYRAGLAVGMQALAVSAVVSLTLFVSAPTAIRFLPEAYRETADVVQILAVLPMIKAMQFALGNALTASDHQVTRLRLTVAASVLNLCLNLVFIPAGGWQAAALTTLASEAALLAGIWLAGWRGARRPPVLGAA